MDTRTRLFKGFGGAVVIGVVALFVGFLVSDINNGPLPPEDTGTRFSQAMSGEVSLICTSHNDGGNGFAITDEVLITGDAVRFDFQEEEHTGQMIITDERDSYIWMDGETSGVFISQAVLERSNNGDAPGISLIEQSLSSIFAAMEEEGMLSCKEERVAGDRLLPPDHIDFISIGSV